MERVEVAEGVGRQTSGEGIAQVVERMRPSIVGDQSKARVAEVLGLEFDVEGVIGADTVAATNVDVRILLIKARVARRDAGDRVGIRACLAGYRIGTCD